MLRIRTLGKKTKRVDGLEVKPQEWGEEMQLPVRMLTAEEVEGKKKTKEKKGGVAAMPRGTKETRQEYEDVDLGGGGAEKPEADVRLWFMKEGRGV